MRSPPPTGSDVEGGGVLPPHAGIAARAVTTAAAVQLGRFISVLIRGIHMISHLRAVAYNGIG